MSIQPHSTSTVDADRDRDPTSAGPGALSRRRFLHLAGLSGAGLAVVMATPGLAARKPIRRWSNRRTWGGRVPGPGTVAVVEGRVLLDRNVTVAGVVIRPGAELIFQARRNRVLRSRGNVIVRGKLTMQPRHRGRVHRLEFVGVRERRFRGGGMEPLRTDVGLWVRPGGRLSLRGAPKLAWTRATESIAAGANQIRVAQDPTGWRPGDELLLTPTGPGQRQDGFEVLRVAAISGRDVTLTGGTGRAHPALGLPGGGTLGPEVANLTRNVQVQGTRTGFSHVHMVVRNPQVVRHVALRYMGLRDPLGRYALHFHHSMGGTRRTLVDGVVIRDSKGRAFVPHMSHGITFRRCVAYNVQTGFWWDRHEGDGSVAQTHDTTYVDCLAARGDDVGFLMNFGHRNTVRGSVAIGFFEPRRRGSGFFWPAGPAIRRGEPRYGEIWTFEDNVAHNNQIGMFVWQNTSTIHPVEGTLTYHNDRTEVLHGAYRNPYQYTDCTLLGQLPLDLHACSNMGSTKSDRQRWIRTEFLTTGAYAVRIGSPSLPASAHTLLLDCTFQGGSARTFRIDQPSGQRGWYDIVRSTVGDRDLEPSDFHVVGIHPETLIRVQRRDDAAFQITQAGVTDIPPFHTGL